MSVDKRSVSTDALETLGTIIDENQKRDAIHIAVEPAIAAHRLKAGDHVGIVDGKASQDAENLLGIVDPFVQRVIKPGERFWLLVYPRKITSLRHVWSHPDFPEHEDTTVRQKEIRPSKDASEAWLRDFAKNNDVPWYEGMMDAVKSHIEERGPYWSDEYVMVNGSDAHAEIPPEFWVHFEMATGIKVPEEKRAEHFSCSC